MRIKLSEHTFANGVKSIAVLYKPHWWSAWRFLMDNDGDVLCVNKPLDRQRESVMRDLVGLRERRGEGYDTRLDMLSIVLHADEVYVGSRNGDGYTLAYDVDDISNLETLRNLEELS